MTQHKTLLSISVLLVLFALAVFCTPVKTAAQIPGSAQPLLPENAVQKISDHVYVIMGFPNIGIVVGNSATLVVDTGLGPRNGATIAREVAKLTKNSKLFLTTTHYHPEHASGEPGFPPNTVLIRNQAQQDDMDQHGSELIDRFRNISPLDKELLQDVKLRKPDVVFDREAKIDLGGITARLFWLGPAHTRGDELIFIEEDSVLLSGDIVENKLVPSIPNEDASVKSWISILDKLAPLKPGYIIPDHGLLGDGSLIAQERAFIVDMQSRAQALKRQGTSADDAARTIASEFQQKYPDWGNPAGISNVVRRIYAESE